MNATSSRTIIASMLLLATLLASWPAQAEVPNFVTYSGRLTDGTAWGESTQADLTFWLCEQEQGDIAACIWTETKAGVPLEDGYFSVRLGETEALPAPLPAAAWLAVAVDNGQPLLPRQSVGAVPYALRAKNADVLGGDTLQSLKVLLGVPEMDDARFVLNLRNVLTGDCPPDYERVEDDDPVTVESEEYYCRKHVGFFPSGEKKYDEMVKVGDFWIDRYELSLWSSPDCSGGPKNSVNPQNLQAEGFFRNGQDDPTDPDAPAFDPMFACSVLGVTPTRWITWFQAQQACAASGKRLCSNAEWQAAASGTPDDAASCNIETSGPEVTGHRAACKSRYGAYDMVGNLTEWTANWHGLGDVDADGGQPCQEFHGDGYWDVKGAHASGDCPAGDNTFPASAARGGAWSMGTKAGVFALALNSGPARWDEHFGARCCRR